MAPQGDGRRRTDSGFMRILAGNPAERVPPCVVCRDAMRAVSVSVLASHLLSAVLALIIMMSATAPGYAQITPQFNPLLSAKPDPLLAPFAFRTGQSKVVVTAADPGSLDAVAVLIQQLGGRLGWRLSIINGQAATVPNSSLMALASSDVVRHVALDRLIVG